MRLLPGRGAVAKRLVRGGAVAKRHRENAGGSPVKTGRGDVAELLAGASVLAVASKKKPAVASKKKSQPAVAAT